jgi:hypothetical protein
MALFDETSKIYGNLHPRHQYPLSLSGVGIIMGAITNADFGLSVIIRKFGVLW